MALTKVPSNLDATVATTQSASDNSTNVATTAYVTTAIANLVDGAPSTLNTLDEIAAALNDDAALNTTLTNSIATKLPLAGGTLTGNITVVGSEVRVQRPSGGSSYFGILMDSGEKVRLRNSYANKDIYYDRDGKLGINNSSPDELLHISGGGIKVDGEATIASGSGTGVFLDYASDVGRITALDQGTAWKTLRLNAAKLEFYIANGPQVEINSSGNLGVGVTNPQAPLSVQADSGATVARFIGRAADNIASMGFYNNAQSADTYIQSNSSWIRARADGGFHFRKGNTPIVTDVDGFTINGMNVGIGTANPDNILHLNTTAAGGPQIHFDDGTNSGFIGFDGTNIQLATQRDMVDGTWHNTGKSWGGINIQGPSGGSQITMQTAPNSNTSPTTRLVIDKNGGTILGSTANTAGHSFEVQDRSDGYSMFWTGRNSSGEGRGITNAYGLLGVNSTQYDGDGATYPVAGFGAAADNASHESVDFWFGTTTSEWQPMVFMCIGAHTSGTLTGHTAGWALIRATHYNNGVSFNIMDSGGGGTWTTSVQGSYGADRANTSRCRITFSGAQNRTVLSVWGANYSQFYGASRA